jgi:methylmalonyl-CoA mutase N-terminal domain/subunit
VAIQAIAAVLGGTQSLHTNSMDEAYAVPSAKAVKIALRTQQIIAHESGVVNTIDPLGGSYFVEYLTDRMEEEAYAYFDKIDKLGGVIPALKKGFFQNEIARAAYRYQKETDDKDRIIVGVNDFVEETPVEIALVDMDPQGEKKHLDRLNRLRRDRDGIRTEKSLDELRKAAEGDVNVMPFILDCVKAHATLGETCGVLREVFGEYREPIVY